MRRRFAATAAGAIALSTLAVPPLAGASPAATPKAQVVTLVTGERVLIREVAGKPVATVEGGGAYATQMLGEDLYVIPAAAMPYLGRSLDRSLFDVSAMLRDGLTGDTRIPVQLSYVDTPVAVPGVDAGVVKDSKAFGEALKTQAGRDAASRFAGPGTLFAGVSSIRLAAAGAPQQATPRFPMHTVKILATGADGKPAVASAGVVNTDDARKYRSFTDTIGGEARISVPDGHYSIVSFFPEFDTQGRLTLLRGVTTDFTVSGGDTQTTVDARAATSPVSLSTPLPATPVDGSVGFARGDSAGQTLGFTFNFGGDLPILVSPVTTAPTGALHFSIGAYRESPAGTANPYTYDVKLDNAGTIPADQHHQVRDDQIARLQVHYFSDVPARKEGSSRILFLPFDVFGIGSFHLLTAPLNRTEYVGGSDVSSTQAVLAGWDTFGGFTVDGFRTYAPRTTTNVDWLRGPVAPGLRTPVNPADQWLCEACRMDDTIDLAVAAGFDSAGHEQFPDRPSPGTVVDAHYRLTSGDTVIADAKDTYGAEVTVPPERKNYRLTFDRTSIVGWTHQSTASHTEWTFTSAHSGKRTVPDNILCGQDGTAPDCSALSLLTANYRLDTAMDGTISARQGKAVVTFGHTPGAWNLPIRQAKFEVSFDGGTTWQRACLDQVGYNRYRATWDNPSAAKATDVALRVSATDIFGASISQRVTAAYTVPPQS